MTNFVKILVLIAISVSLSGCGLGNKPPVRKSKGTQVKPVKKPGTPSAPTSTDPKTTDPKATPAPPASAPAATDTTANNLGEIIGMWQEILMDPMPAYEDNYRTTHWRIGKHHITRTARCTLDGKPVILAVSSPSNTIGNKIFVQEDRKKDDMDNNGEKICDVALTKGPIQFELVDSVLVLRFGKETVFLQRFKAAEPAAAPPVQP